MTHCFYLLHRLFVFSMYSAAVSIHMLLSAGILCIPAYLPYSFSGHLEIVTPVFSYKHRISLLIRIAIQIIPKIDIVLPFCPIPFHCMDMMCTRILFKITNYKQYLPGNIFSAKNKIILSSPRKPELLVPTQIAGRSGSVQIPGIKIPQKTWS